MTLRIGTQIYSGGAQLLAPVGNETDGFESAVNTALERIRSTEVGAELLREIASANQEVLIVKAGQNQGNTCVQSMQTEQACNAACYTEVLNHISLRGKIQDLISKKTIQQGHPAIAKYMKFYGPHSIHKTTVRQQPIPLAHTPKNDRSHSADETLKSRISLLDDKPKIDEAIGLVRYLQNGLVAYHLMDHLTRGSGTGAWVVWDPLLESVGTNLLPQNRAAWMDRPAWVALAHELIHGWRLASGRCVFRPSGLNEYYYEEAMTVGLPPYDKCDFTENRFRHLKGLPLRTFYGESTQNQSNHAANKHGTVANRIKLSIKVEGSGPDDPLVFDYEIRSASEPHAIIASGKTDSQGRATAHGMREDEIRFRGFGAFGRVETQWQKIATSKYMNLQFGRYRFICEPL